MDTKIVSDDITNLHNTIVNYKEKIKEAVNFVNPQNNPNISGVQKHQVNTSNFINPNIPSININANVNRNLNINPENNQQQSINNPNSNINK